MGNLIKSMSDFASLGESVTTENVQELLMVLEANKVNRFVEQLETIKWCPTPDCSLAVKLPKFLSKRPCVNYFYSLTTDTTESPTLPRVATRSVDQFNTQNANPIVS